MRNACFHTGQDQDQEEMLEQFLHNQLMVHITHNKVLLVQMQ